jgi:hypothetical protein
MTILRVCEWLEATPVGSMVRESTYGFQVLVAIHILGLTISVGTLVWFDLRLLGRNMPGCPVSEMYRRLMPLTFAGFLIMFVSGFVLFTGYATSAYANAYFRIKLLAILGAGVNALVYHRLTERRIAEWDDAHRPPAPARAAGLISIGLWTVVILAGRMMAYTLYG